MAMQIFGRVSSKSLRLKFINFFHDVDIHIESRCIIKAKHVLLLFDIALEKLHLCWSARAIFPTQNQMN